MRAVADGGPRRGGAHHTGPEDYHGRGRNARGAAQQDAPAARGRLEQVGRDVDRHRSRDLAHRAQDRDVALAVLDHLHGDGRDTPVQQGLDPVRRGDRRNEKAHEHAVFAEQAVFLGSGRQNFHDQVRPAVDLFGLVRNVGSGGQVVVVGESRGGPGEPLDEDPVARTDQTIDTGRRQGHPTLGLRVLEGDPDVQGSALPRVWPGLFRKLRLKPRVAFSSNPH